MRCDHRYAPKGHYARLARGGLDAPCAGCDYDERDRCVFPSGVIAALDWCDAMPRPDGRAVVLVKKKDKRPRKGGTE